MKPVSQTSRVGKKKHFFVWHDFSSLSRHPKTILRGLAILLFGITLQLAAQTSEPASENQIRNAGFEEGGSCWRLTAGGTVIKNGAADGGQALQLGTTGKTAFIYALQDITRRLKPSTEYEFTVDIKRNGISKGTVMAAVMTKDAVDAADWTSKFTCGFQGMSDQWENFKITFKTPERIVQGVVMLYNINTGGTVWYDNLVLKEVSTPAK